MSKNKFDRREFMVKSGKAAAAAAIGSSIAPHVFAQAAQTRPPNIIIIFADDLGYGDIGCFGSEAISTPNLDSLAAEGAHMTDFFSSAPVCSPSRAGLLTGRYPPRTEVIHVFMPSKTAWGAMWNAVNRLPQGLPLDEITIAEALKPHGYATCCIGKWHLGDKKEYRPHRRGFDHYTGLLYSNDMWPLELYRNDEIIDDHPADQTKLTGIYTEEAVKFIDGSHSQPFFLYLPHTFPHVPLHASKKFRGRSRGGLYGDAIEEIDWSTGQILEALERHGIADNTLILFSSDNGPWYQGSTGGWRGRKGETYDGGMRVPFLARWPGHIPAGKVIDEPAMNIDMFSTTLAAAGVPLPSDRVIDGKNLLPLLEGKQTKTPHEAIFFYNMRELQAVRVGQWKYHRRHRLAMIPPLKKGPWLFNTEEDPYESYNVADKYSDVTRKLEALMTDWEKNFGRGIHAR